MPAKKRVDPAETLPLKLTTAEKKLILEGLTLLDPTVERVIQATPGRQPVMLSPDDLQILGDNVMADANHCADKAKARKLLALFAKIQAIEESSSAVASAKAPMTKTEAREIARTKKQIAKLAQQVTKAVAQLLVLIKKAGLNDVTLAGFQPTSEQRAMLRLLNGVKTPLKKKITKKGTTFTFDEVALLAQALVHDLPDDNLDQQIELTLFASELVNELQTGFTLHLKPFAVRSPQAKPSAASELLFQFKIALVDSKPAIWRRIQITDCTLDQLHHYIQLAMGWTNSHLHQFTIGRQRYGDPALLDDGFGDVRCMNSTVTKVSHIVPKSGKRFAFMYEYDFGDGWQHEVLFEGHPPRDAKAKYPLCLEGACACPPEDCGGIWGYGDLLEAAGDPKHPEHEEISQWLGTKFDPEEFDAAKTSRRMKKGQLD